MCSNNNLNNETMYYSIDNLNNDNETIEDAFIGIDTIKELPSPEGRRSWRIDTSFGQLWYIRCIEEINLFTCIRADGLEEPLFSFYCLFKGRKIIFCQANAKGRRLMDKRFLRRFAPAAMAVNSCYNMGLLDKAEKDNENVLYFEYTDKIADLLYHALRQKAEDKAK